MIRPAFLPLLFGLVCSTAWADVLLPPVFSDHIVLQRDRPIAVWGRAAPDEKITVTFAGRRARTKADAAGVWRTQLRAVRASSEPRDLIVAGANTITLHDVLVGDVWLCAGQSNMEMKVGVATPGAKPESAYDPALAAELPTAAYPRLRLLRLDKNWDTGAVAFVGWNDARGEALGQFSAVGFFFGRELHQTLGIPIGLIQAAVGGSRLEEWIPDEAYASLEPLLAADTPPRFERDSGFVGRNYDRMIAPFAPGGLRGVLWYQGESNLIGYHDGLRYADKFAALVAHWRALWRHPDLPFYAVQIAPFAYSARTKDKLPHAPDELPRLWEAQQRATAIPHTGLVPIADTVSDVHNIHPGGKTTVGHRLAALALAATYDRPGLIASGPVFRSVEARDDALLVHFDHAGGGLTTRDGAAPDSFEIAGTDGRFVPATAVIRARAVELKATSVARPVSVRFAWSETAQPNLMNRAGWPAYPFRSDGPTWTPPAR